MPDEDQDGAHGIAACPGIASHCSAHHMRRGSTLTTSFADKAEHGGVHDRAASGQQRRKR